MTDNSSSLPAFQPSNQQCTYCSRPAVSPGYIQPAMCQKHHSLAIVVSLLRNRGNPVTYDAIRVVAAFYHRAGLEPSEIEGLLATMPGVLDEERHAHAA